MIKKALFILVILLLLFVSQGLSATKLNYTYSFTEDTPNQDYIFSITFHENFIIYNISLSINGISYPLISGLANNSFYTYLGNNILNEIVQLHLNTSQGPLSTSFQVLQQNSTSKEYYSNDVIAFFGFFILVIILSKYVLFFKQSSS